MDYNDIDFNALAEEINSLLDEGDFDLIYEKLEELQIEELNSFFWMMKALAMTKSEKYFNYADACELMEAASDDLSESENWNYIMAELHLRAFKYVSALKYIDKEISLMDDDSPAKSNRIEVKKEIINDIHTGDCGMPFNYRVKFFWNDFIENREQAEKLLETQEQADADKFMEFFNFLLLSNYIDASATFIPSAKSDKYHIYFPLDDDINKYMMLKQLLILMPEELNDDYLFSLGALQAYDFTLQLGDKLINYTNTQVAFFQNRKKVDLYFKNDALEKLNKEDPSEATMVAKVLAQNFIGEVFCLKNVSNVYIYGGEDLEFCDIALLINQLRKLFGDLSYVMYPYDDYSYFRLEEKEEKPNVRDHIKTILTCVDELTFDYLEQKTEFFDYAFDQGIVYFSLVCSVKGFAFNDALTIRKYIEDKVKAKKGDSLEIVGVANSDNYIYIDLVVFDMEEFRNKIVEECFKNAALELGVSVGYINVFRCGAPVFVYFNSDEDKRKKTAVLQQNSLMPLSKEYDGNLPKYSYSEEEASEVQEFIIRTFGDLSDRIYETGSDDMKLELFVSPPGKLPCFTISTRGMGAYKMEIPTENIDENIARAELVFCLPEDWDGSYETNSKYGWMFDWLRYIAHMPLDEETWLKPSHTIESEKHLVGEDGFKGFIIMHPGLVDEQTYFKLGDDDVNFYQIIPMYENEIRYRQEYGMDPLLDKLGKKVNFNEFFICNTDRENSVSDEDLGIDKDNEE